MSEFLPAVEVVLQNEGGLIDDPLDHGGVTNYGISYRFYKHHFPEATQDDIRDLTRSKAIELYFTYFWLAAPFSELRSQSVANGAFDAAVNCGVANSVKILQRAYNACRAKHGALLDDGILGKDSIEAINSISFIPMRTSFRSERAAYFREIVAKNPSQEVFLHSWLERAYSV